MLQNLVAVEYIIGPSKCIDFDLPNYWTNCTTSIAELHQTPGMSCPGRAEALCPHPYIRDPSRGARQIVGAAHPAIHSPFLLTLTMGASAQHVPFLDCSLWGSWSITIHSTGILWMGFVLSHLRYLKVRRLNLSQSPQALFRQWREIGQRDESLELLIS